LVWISRQDSNIESPHGRITRQNWSSAKKFLRALTGSTPTRGPREAVQNLDRFFDSFSARIQLIRSIFSGVAIIRPAIPESQGNEGDLVKADADTKVTASRLL
jgi:hypothetical protein